MKSIDVLQRLIRLEQTGRVVRAAPKSDSWTVSRLELSDADRRSVKTDRLLRWD